MHTNVNTDGTQRTNTGSGDKANLHKLVQADTSNKITLRPAVIQQFSKAKERSSIY